MKTLILTLISVLLLDSETKEPLTGVEVTDVCTGKTYYSDLDGMVNLPDSCLVDISYISYNHIRTTVVDSVVFLDQE